MSRFPWEEPEYHPAIDECEDCRGTGIIEDPQSYDWIDMVCPYCWGDGYFDIRCGCPSEHHWPTCQYREEDDAANRNFAERKPATESTYRYVVLIRRRDG